MTPTRYCRHIIGMSGKIFSLRITRSRSWSAATRPRTTALNAVTFKSSGFSARDVRRSSWRRSRAIRRRSKILWRYNDHGLAGLGDGRLDNPVPPRCLTGLSWGSCATWSASRRPTAGRAQGGALDTGRIGRTVSPQRSVEYLRRLDLTRQVPRPANPKASLYEQARFKENYGGKASCWKARCSRAAR